MIKSLIYLLLGISGMTANVVSPLSTTTISLQTEISTTSRSLEFKEELLNLNPIIATTSTKVAVKKIDKKPIQNLKVVKKEVVVKTEQKPTSPLPGQKVDFKKINEDVRPAIVNIICTSESGGYFNPISASGVMIDPRGIILTNAHIAQYLIPQDEHGKNLINCIARTGSPATATYKIKVLYISPFWVKQNYKSIGADKYTETGENDFALLKITGNTSDQVLLKPPYKFLEISDNSQDLKKDNSVLLAGYPAEFLDGIFTQRELYLASTIVKLGEIFTFRSGSQDIFQLGGSTLAQQGSSGGAVVDSNKKLLGIIVTSKLSSETKDRELQAISIIHINNSLLENSGIDLSHLLKTNTDIFEQEFYKQVMPTLTNLLTKEFQSKQ